MNFRWWPKKFIDDERSNIGTVLLNMGVVTDDELKFALEMQTRSDSTRLGDLLVELGTIDKNELSDALDFQKQMRNGKGADAMLSIVEKRTDAHQLRVSQTIQALTVIMPVLASNMTGVGYVVFDEELAIRSALVGPLGIEDTDEVSSFTGRHVDDFTHAWAGADIEADAATRFRPIYEATIKGVEKEMFLAVNGKRVKMKWVPVEIDDDIVLGMVIGQTVETLMDSFNDSQPAGFRVDGFSDLDDTEPELITMKL